MTLRGSYAKGVAARRRVLRAAAEAAVDPNGRLDLASLSGSAQLTTGGVLHHFRSRDGALVAANLELADDPSTSDSERAALARELIRIACDRTSPAFSEARAALRAIAGGSDPDRLGALLLNALR